jgi:hypothetical protein
VAFSVRSRNTATSDKLFVGIEHWDSGVHFVKSRVMPPVNRTQKAPDYEHNGAIFWKDVPHRTSRSFKASFFSDKKGTVEFHPGACLQDGSTKYCCKYVTLKVRYDYSSVNKHQTMKMRMLFDLLQSDLLHSNALTFSQVNVIDP